MSIIGFSNPDRHYRKSTHQRNDSGELDVFEATRYFSGGTEAHTGYTNGIVPNNGLREERHKSGGVRRMSLDMQTRNPLPSQSHVYDKQIKEKKHKQPSSPGGKLASFLNSLFHQAASKKKKAKSMKDEDESPGGRRKRRSSISHYQTVNTSTSLKSIYSSTNSGFRTPPPNANTPIKLYKDSCQVVSSLPAQNGEPRSIDEKMNMDLSWLDEKFKYIDGFSEKNKKMLEKKYLSEKKDLRTVIADVLDDGAESDSSSDLFELQNTDLGVYSSGLPVYETTRMECIKRGA